MLSGLAHVTSSANEKGQEQVLKMSQMYSQCGNTLDIVHIQIPHLVYKTFYDVATLFPHSLP